MSMAIDLIPSLGLLAAYIVVEDSHAYATLIYNETVLDTLSNTYPWMTSVYTNIYQPLSGESQCTADNFVEARVVAPDHSQRGPIWWTKRDPVVIVVCLKFNNA